MQLLRDGTVVATRVGNGPITDPGRVPDGVHQYTAREVDASNNVGPASGATQVTIDTTAARRAAAPVLLAADDSGTVGDGITNVKQPRLTGTAEAGSTVRLLSPGPSSARAMATGGTYTIQLKLGPGRRDVLGDRDGDRRRGKHERVERGIHLDDRHHRRLRRRRLLRCWRRTTRAPWATGSPT